MACGLGCTFMFFGVRQFLCRFLISASCQDREPPVLGRNSMASHQFRPCQFGNIFNGHADLPIILGASAVPVFGRT
jgi:hypothetical protein